MEPAQGCAPGSGRPHHPHFETKKAGKLCDAGHLEQIEISDALAQTVVTPRDYFRVSARREEKVDSPARLEQLIGSLNAGAARWMLPVLTNTHPRSEGAATEVHPLVRLH